MNPESLMAALFLPLSLLLQCWAVLQAFRLIPLSKRRRPWMLLATAVLVHLFHHLARLTLATEGYKLSLVEESIRLATSSLLVAGLHWIAPIFQDFHRALQARNAAVTRLQEEGAASAEGRRTLEAILEATRDGIVLIDDELRFTAANPAAENILQLSRHKLIGRNISEFSGIELEVAWKQFLEAGEYRGENRVVHTDGSICEVAVAGCANILPGRHLFVLHDITESKRLMAQQELLVVELEGVIHSIADGLVLYGPDGEVRQRNPAADAIFGYSDEEWGKPLAERPIRGNFRTTTGQPMRHDDLPVARALKGEVVRSTLMSLPRPDGRTLWISASAAPILMANGRTIGAVGTFADITPLREMQQRMENFQHMIAHDLRAPLTVILGHAEMLQPEIEKCSESEIPRLNLQSILQAGSQMAGMVDDLVDLARLENERLALRPEPVDLRTFLAEFVGRNRVTMDITRAVVDLPNGLPRAWADPLRLERIVGNLVSNALKYSPSDASIILRGQRQGAELLISVADEGEGIAAEELPRIFDLFFRSGSDSHRQDGLGLGLYITRSLIEAHGGRIWVESAIGRGSTFFFTLPAALVPQ